MRNRAFISGALVVVVAAALLPLAPPVAEAKGAGAIVIGGGTYAPYYYAIPGTAPRQLFLLAMPGVAPGDLPAGRISAPWDAAALLAGAYDLYDAFALNPDGSPAARYVPAADAHPAYIVWQAQGTNTPPGWFRADAETAAYLDHALRVMGKAQLETDPMAALAKGVFSSLAPPGASLVQPEYVLGPVQAAPDATLPPVHITGADASRLIPAFVASLHHPRPYERAFGGYYVDAAGTTVFVFQPATSTRPARVEAVGFGSQFEADPQLASIISRALDGGRARIAPAAVAATDAPRSSRTALIVAAAVAAAFMLALGGTTLAMRRVNVRSA